MCLACRTASDSRSTNGALIAGAENTAVLRGAAQGRANKEVSLQAKTADRCMSSDEIHTVGCWCRRGLEMDAQQPAQPMLARVAALHRSTTLDEHRQHIEKDPALERRFQQVVRGSAHGGRHDLDLRGLKGAMRSTTAYAVADTRWWQKACLSSPLQSPIAS